MSLPSSQYLWKIAKASKAESNRYSRKGLRYIYTGYEVSYQGDLWIILGAQIAAGCIGYRTNFYKFQSKAEAIEKGWYQV